MPNFDDMLRTGQWPDVDPRRTVLLEQRAGGPRSRRRRRAARARIVSYRNTEVVVEVDTPASVAPGAQRRLASVVARDASTVSRRTSSRPTCCSAPSRCRPASTRCASPSTRSAARWRSCWDEAQRAVALKLLNTMSGALVL